LGIFETGEKIARFPEGWNVSKPGRLWKFDNFPRTRPRFSRIFQKKLQENYQKPAGMQHRYKSGEFPKIQPDARIPEGWSRIDAARVW
jgi:hypothetical protein